MGPPRVAIGAQSSKPRIAVTAKGLELAFGDGLLSSGHQRLSCPAEKGCGAELTGFRRRANNGRSGRRLAGFLLLRIRENWWRGRSLRFGRREEAHKETSASGDKGSEPGISSSAAAAVSSMIAAVSARKS